MSLAARLWHGQSDLANAARTHPFVTGLADGSLSLAAFQIYVAQDAYFLEAFARAYALALAHSRDRHSLETFTDLLVGVKDELVLHDDYSRSWGVPVGGAAPVSATLAYTGFLLAMAALGDVGLTCAAMTPCMRLYAHLGQFLAAGPVAVTYARWVTTYADPGFESLTAGLERLLDQHAADDETTASTYRRAMTLELAFFEAAYAPGG